MGLTFSFLILEYAIIGDVEPMSHQVIVLKEDTDSLRFLWRENFNISLILISHEKSKKKTYNDLLVQGVITYVYCRPKLIIIQLSIVFQ